MAVNWLWKDKLGEIQYKDLESNQNWKLEMFGGNMMCCFIYRYKKENGEKYYTFFTWFNDMKHAKTCLKDIKLEDFARGNQKVKKVRIKITTDNKYSKKEMLQLAKLLTEMKYKVELY